MEPIRLIPQDLRRTELLQQVAHLLQSLDKCATSVFSRIEHRIQELDQDLADIDRRSEGCRQMVDQVRTLKNRVVRIYCSSRFPSPDEMAVRQYRPLPPVTIACHPGARANAATAVVPVTGIHVPFSEEVLKEKLQFYPFPVLVSSDRGPDHDHHDDSSLSSGRRAAEPLGRIPFHRLRSVSSLIMFDSSANPYIGSSLTHVEKTRRKREQEEEAPDVSLNMSGLRSQDRHNEADEDDLLFGFQVSQSLAPALIDLLPSALPDLDGIAQDMLFDFDDQDQERTGASTPLRSAAPAAIALDDSGAGMDQERGMAAAAITSTPVPAPRKASIVPKSDSKSAGPGSTTSAPPPPAPPPPPIGLLTSPPAPPPPPPPPPAATMEASPAAGAAMGDGGRASLLDSIRKAGGKPKKGQVSVKDLKIEKKKIKQAEKTSAAGSSSGGGGDLMSDLMSSLKARRIGISGSSQDPATLAKSMRRTVSMPSDPSPSADPTVGAMSRISAMIPDPPAASVSRTAILEDDDGDSDEWD